MFNTKIQGAKISCSITSANFSTSPNNLMNGVIKGKIKYKDNSELFFNTRVLFTTKPDDRFSFAALDNITNFVLSREQVEVVTQADIQAGVKLAGLNRDVVRQLMTEYLMECGYNEYTVSHTEEVVFKIDSAEKITEKAQVDTEETEDYAAKWRTDLYKAVNAKQDEYHAIKQAIKQSQQTVSEAKQRVIDAKNAVSLAEQLYQNEQTRLNGLFMDAIGISDQLTEVSIRKAQERA